MTERLCRYAFVAFAFVLAATSFLVCVSCTDNEQAADKGRGCIVAGHSLRECRDACNAGFDNVYYAEDCRTAAGRENLNNVQPRVGVDHWQDRSTLDGAPKSAQ